MTKELKIIEKHYKDGKLKSIEYTLNGLNHNENGPAYQSWYENGQLATEMFCVDGNYHNENGPAFQTWNAEGKQQIKAYYINGKCSRFDGPAFENSVSNTKQFWFNAIEYSSLEELQNKVKMSLLK